MRRLGDPDLHFFLTRSVARAMGISLGDALRQGDLRPADYAAMVTCCRACPLVHQCQTWLAESQSRRDTPPAGCSNASAFSALLH